MPYAREPETAPGFLMPEAGNRQNKERKPEGTMISEERIRSAFLELAAIDSESYREKAIGKAVTARLRALGLEVITEGTTGRGFLNLHPDSHPNILARLKGTAPGDPVLFSAHLDTVSPGTNKEPVVVEDGTIRSAGETVLGADDLCGIVSILEALRVIRSTNLTLQLELKDTAKASACVAAVPRFPMATRGTMFPARSTATSPSRPSSATSA